MGQMLTTWHTMQPDDNLSRPARNSCHCAYGMFECILFMKLCVDSNFTQLFPWIPIGNIWSLTSPNPNQCWSKSKTHITHQAVGKVPRCKISTYRNTLITQSSAAPSLRNVKQSNQLSLVFISSNNPQGINSKGNECVGPGYSGFNTRRVRKYVPLGVPNEYLLVVTWKGIWRYSC